MHNPFICFIIIIIIIIIADLRLIPAGPLCSNDRFSIKINKDIIIIIFVKVQTPIDTF